MNKWNRQNNQMWLRIYKKKWKILKLK